MSRKRFTDIEKWQDKWFRRLKPKYKLLWMYLVDACDNAGFWEVDLEHAKYYTGFEYQLKEAEEVLTGRIVCIDDKWFVPKFIGFQYGQLKWDCYPHRPVITRLRQYGFLDENLNLINVENKGNNRVVEDLSTLLYIKEKEKDKEKEEEKEKDTELKRMHPLNEWIIKNTPKVNKLPQQMTYEQCENILYQNKDDPEIVKTVLLSMENYKDLLKKYESVYLTLINWIKLNRQRNGSNNKTGRGIVTTPEIQSELDTAFSQRKVNT